jgi:peptide/nickel transport system substrate-binding protein
MNRQQAATAGRPRWRRARTVFAVALAVAAAAVIAACGSSSSGNSSTSAKAQSVISGLKQTGPGLTEATKPSGAHIKGGTVTFAEAPDTPPVYIFPMYSSEYCGNQQSDQLIPMMYRPLYWYGNNYSPTVDYNYSIGQKPVFSDGDKVVTIHLNHYTWSDGETVSARDLEFWMNMLEADPSKEWCGFVPGKSFFPGNVVSYKVVNPTTFQLTLNRGYNPTWVQYNLLSQMYPMPIAWDRTSLSQKAPSPNQANLPDTTKAGAGKVYDFLNALSLKTDSWGTSPIWHVVDGPWQVQSTTTSGGVTLVPNTHYSGPVKPTISKFIEVPYTSESALVDQLKSQGTSALTIAYIPAQYAPLTNSFKNEGYDVNTASLYAFNYFTLNLNNPTVGPVFRQLYFRQAFQHLIDQNGWINHFLHGVAVNTDGPVPSAPPSPLASAGKDSNGPYPFSVPAASKLLSANGWKVVPGGSSYCQKPGTGSGECGTGIKKGETISFNIDTAAGLTAPSEEMQDIQSQAAKIGIKINLTTHPFPTIQETAVRCKPSQPSCKWTAENFGGGWSYSPDYYPTGEDILGSGSLENSGNYASPTMDKLIKATITAPQGQEAADMAKYVHYAETQVPLVYEPTSIGTFVIGAGTLISKKVGGYSANAYGLLEPEQWYLTK